MDGIYISSFTGAPHFAVAGSVFTAHIYIVTMVQQHQSLNELFSAGHGTITLQWWQLRQLYCELWTLAVFLSYTNHFASQLQLSLLLLLKLHCWTCGQLCYGVDCGCNCIVNCWLQLYCVLWTLAILHIFLHHSMCISVCHCLLAVDIWQLWNSADWGCLCR